MMMQMSQMRAGTDKLEKRWELLSNYHYPEKSQDEPRIVPEMKKIIKFISRREIFSR